MTSLDALLSRPRYEVFPAKGTEQAVLDWVPAGMTVTVTASPVKGLDATIEVTERLAARGYRVVPHLAARSVASEAHLTDIVARLKAVGCDEVFVPGGDASHPAGPFDGALPLLERLAEMPTRSAGSASPATRKATPRSTTTSSSRRCGTSAGTRATS